MTLSTHKAWRLLKLGKLVSFKTGKLDSNAARPNGAYPFFTCSQETFRTNTFSFDGEYVLLAGNNANGVYPLKYFKGKFDAYQRTYTIKSLDDRALMNRYLYYALRPKLEFLKSVSTGAATKFLTLTILNDIEIDLPPLPTQRRIAAILSAYDDLIENNARRIAILEEMARNLYREWFVHFRFPRHEDTTFVDRDGMLVPKVWPVVRATDAIDINPTTKVPREGLKPFLPMSSLSDNSMLIGEVEYREGNAGAKFKNADTLFARITPCLENGKTAFVQFLPSDDAVAFGSTEFIVLRSRTLCPEFVYLLARSDEFRDNAIKSMSGATGRQRVQEQSFDRFLFAQPDQQITDLFRAQVAPMFRAVQVLAKKNTNLRRTRDLLLPRLVSGELDVSELEIAGVDDREDVALATLV
jgi:type I restriction enzyme S subunit